MGLDESSEPYLYLFKKDEIDFDEIELNKEEDSETDYLFKTQCKKLRVKEIFEDLSRFLDVFSDNEIGAIFGRETAIKVSRQGIQSAYAEEYFSSENLLEEEYVEFTEHKFPTDVKND